MEKIFIPNENSPVYKQIVDNFKKLSDILENKLKEKNNILIEDFYEFEPLYNSKLKNNLSEEELAILGDKFYNRIDPYQPINIIDNNGNILFTLPAIFVPLDQIKTTNKNQNILENFKIKSTDDNITSPNLTNSYMVEFFKTQLSNEHKKLLKKYREEYIECIKSLNQINETSNYKEIESDNIDNVIEWE